MAIERASTSIIRTIQVKSPASQQISRVVQSEKEIILTSDTRIVNYLHEWSDLEAKFKKINNIEKIFAKTDAVTSIFKRIVAEENE